MDGIINIKVSGNHISKDSNRAGVRGEGNSTNLKIAFDESWGEYAKTVTFFDARGENPVERTLTSDLLTQTNGNAWTYTLPIPFEALTEAGYMTFIIDGYTGGKRKRSVSETLEVEDSPNSRVTVDPTPTQAEQLQSQVDKIIADIKGAVLAKEAAEQSAKNAKQSADEAETIADEVGENIERAEHLAQNAERSADKAEALVGKASYIGENGNWYSWDVEKKEFYDTGVKAQSGSVVYLGDNPPDDADVWLKPDDEYDEAVTLEEIYATANVATETAQSAVEQANSSNSVAGAANTNARAALDSANAATEIAQSALELAVGADDRAANAQTLATEAGSLAGTAKETADDAYSLARVADERAIAARQAADSIGSLVNATGIRVEEAKRMAVDANERTQLIKSDLEGLQKQLNEEAHFRGYLSTNAKIQALEATPNDFGYSAESGTKWVYDETEGWKDTGTPVPDQLTPASNATPLVNGEASAGESEEYARGDHRHPTDTSRASVKALQDLEYVVNQKQDKIKTVYFNDRDTLILQDNTEYVASQNIAGFTLVFPEGDFLCSVSFTIAESGGFSILMPNSKYIGEVPEFSNGETWELNIKNRIVVGGKVE